MHEILEQYKQPSAVRERTALTETKRIVREFGDPNRGQEYHDPYADSQTTTYTLNQHLLNKPTR